MTATISAWPTADVSNPQTVEDGDPRFWPSMTLHHEDTTQEFVQYQVSVRRPRLLTHFTGKLTIRLSQTSTLVTCALEVVTE